MIQILITNKSASNLKPHHRDSAKCSFSATYFMPLVSFFTPLETPGFLMFSRGIERAWYEMGQNPAFLLISRNCCEEFSVGKTINLKCIANMATV